ncbi:MAG TPA: hypothetical protein VGA50_10880 [Kiloniellales bacterium]
MAHPLVGCGHTQEVDGSQIQICLEAVERSDAVKDLLTIIVNLSWATILRKAALAACSIP